MAATSTGSPHAFAVDVGTFDFLELVGGEAVAAQRGVELETALKDIYEGKILAEVDYGERAPGQPEGEQP